MNQRVQVNFIELCDDVKVGLQSVTNELHHIIMKSARPHNWQFLQETLLIFLRGKHGMFCQKKKKITNEGPSKPRTSQGWNNKNKSSLFILSTFLMAISKDPCWETRSWSKRIPLNTVADPPEPRAFSTRNCLAESSKRKAGTEISKEREKSGPSESEGERKGKKGYVRAYPWSYLKESNLRSKLSWWPSKLQKESHQSVSNASKRRNAYASHFSTLEESFPSNQKESLTNNNGKIKKLWK